MNTTKQGTTVTLVYSPPGTQEIVRHTFTGLTPDDLIAVTSALAGRRINHPLVHEADMQQFRGVRDRQMTWYADRTLKALYDGAGPWFRLLPLRVRTRTVNKMLGLLRDITATWTGELLAVHGEVSRLHEQARKLRLLERPAPVSEPLVRCRCCPATFERSDFLPEGWTADDDAQPRCPKHRVVTLEKEPVG